MTPDSAGIAISAIDPASYYADLTQQYGRYAGAARGWHYGLWEPDVRSHQQALLRSNEWLARGVPLGPDARVLDAGCGIGGFSTWMAATHQCRVTGITICQPHPAMAQALAARAGVGDRCRFLAMDMDALAFSPATFDLVVNQDTLCHVADKPAYLAAVARVLKPGGAWRALDFAVKDAPLSAEEQREYRAACEGFHMPSMASAAEVRDIMEGAGYTDIACVDVTPLVRRTARMIIGQCRGPEMLRALGLDWLIFSRDPQQLANRRGHIRAALAYSRGLFNGSFRHMHYSARVPAASLSSK